MGTDLRLVHDGTDTSGDLPAGDITARVISNDWVNPEYKHLVLAAGDPATRAEAGQFFHLLCPGDGPKKPFLRRPMSIYGVDPDQGRIEFLYKVTGLGTRGLATLKPGDDLPVLGPLGVGFSIEPSWRHIVVLGRGVGLATLAPLSTLASQRGVHVTAILSARRPDLVMSVDRFERCGADVIVVTDSDGSSDPANVEAHLRRLIAAGHADAFFTCGSNRLILLMQWLAREHGIPGQVAMEQQMACGLGMCFCCVRSFKVNGQMVSRRVCWDGPVFKLEEATSW